MGRGGAGGALGLAAPPACAAPSTPDPSPGQVLEGDVCDAELLGTLFVRHGLTHVAHLAAQAPLPYLPYISPASLLHLPTHVAHLVAQAGPLLPTHLLRTTYY